ncbi:MAG: hypothetical protein GWN58_21155 [Anaerolineae bacterium]|nr:hypothetical protein [Anaerolineae bacterium]
MPTREEIERLKAQWCSDPCWDIEHTEGFEEHEEELREYRESKEAEWDQEAENERNRDPLDKAKDWMDPVKQSYAGPKPDKAIAYALIALVERLDKLTDTDGADPGRGYLRIDTGTP